MELRLIKKAIDVHYPVSFELMHFDLESLMMIRFILQNCKSAIQLFDKK